QAIVEDTPFAVLASPDDREVLIFAVDALAEQVDLIGVKAQKYTNVFARIILDLVNLVMKSEVALQVPQTGELGILHDQGRLEFSPGMAIEAPPEHLAVLRPGEESDGGAVNADESLAIITDK